MKKWLLWAWLVHTFVPFRSQPPAVLVAVERMLAKSDPESGSLIPMEKKILPATMSGISSRFASSVPCLRIDGPD